MATILELRVVVGPDGRLALDVPAEPGEYRVTLARTRTLPHDWPDGYFERTAGSIPDFALDPQDTPAESREVS